MASLRLFHVLVAAATLSSVRAVDSTYKGCFTPGAPDELRLWKHVSDYNSVAMCSDTCAFHNYTVAGLVVESYCFCGDSYGDYVGTNETDCSSVCSGNSQETCGGPSVTSIYEIQRTGSPTDDIAPAHYTYTYRGCQLQTNSTADVADLPFHAYATGSNSIAFCAWMCARFHYSFAGLHGGECSCGDGFGQLGPAPSDSSCNYACDSGPDLCGGDDGVLGVAYNSVYEVTVPVTADSTATAYWTALPARLLNHTLVTGDAASVVACALLCCSKAGCWSFNFIDASLREGDNCELNSDTDTASPPCLSSTDAGWYYYYRQ